MTDAMATVPVSMVGWDQDRVRASEGRGVGVTKEHGAVFIPFDAASAGTLTEPQLISSRSI